MLQVTLDDAGVDPAIDAAIISLVNARAITSVALLVNYPRFEEMAKRLQHSSAFIGIHLNISSGFPLSPPELISSLVDSRGRFWSPAADLKNDAPFQDAIYSYIAALGGMDQTHAEIECNAQWCRFISRIGREPDFLTFHHDLDLSEKIRDMANHLFPRHPCRQERLRSGSLERYECMFSVPGEDVHEYGNRIKKRIEEWANDTSTHTLAVFHPSAALPSQLFTIYRAGRLNEYSFLARTDTTQFLKLNTGTELGRTNAR